MQTSLRILFDGGAIELGLLPLEAASAANYSLDCEAGSYSITGQTASLTATRLLTADAGSYSITGQAATLTVDRVLSADAGSYIYTGQDATLVYTVPTAYSLNCESGNYVYTGQDITLVAVITSKGGGLVSEAVNWERLNRLRRQQSYIKDDEEALALILAELTRRN